MRVFGDRVGCDLVVVHARWSAGVEHAYDEVVVVDW